MKRRPRQRGIGDDPRRKAISIIQELTQRRSEQDYPARSGITDFGAFVEIMPGTDGLLHVCRDSNHRSRMFRRAEGRRADLVKVITSTPRQVRLSRKALLQQEDGAPRPTITLGGH